MDRALKRLFRLYPIARNWTILSNYAVPLQSIQSMSRICSTSLTDYTLEDPTQSVKKKHSSRNRKLYHMKILENVANNYTNLTVHDAVDTMSMLFKVSKNAGYMQNVVKHAGFAHLCEILNRDIRLMKMSDIIESLKILTLFNVPATSILVQSLLQMIRASVNKISLHDIIFIAFMLKKMNSTPLRDALLIALPMVFEIQAPVKLDPTDIGTLAWSLRFTSENNINNPEVHEVILKSLRKYEYNMTVETAWSVFYSLCHMSDLPPTALEVLYNVQSILITNAKQLSHRKIIKTLDNLLLVTINNKEHGHEFYNETLVDALVNSTLSSNISFYDGIQLLKLLNKLNYEHKALLEYLAANCFERPNLLKDANYIILFTFLEGLVNADHKPVFWDTIRDAILANVEMTENKSIGRSMIRFVLHLTVLDCYSSNFLSRVFSENIKRDEPLRNIYAQELLLLYQGVRALYPAYNGPWPSQEILTYATTLGPIFPTFSLRASLELALGGSQYVHNGLRTKLGHYVDHVVVMRKGGYPVAINTSASETGSVNISYVEDIETPSESQIILIFNLPDNAYTINSTRFKSTWSLRIRSAQALTNSNMVAINSSTWMKLPEHERVSYLMRAIKLKCEDLSVSAN